MLQKTLAIFLVLIMTLPSALKFAILVDFKINQDFIAKVLCINKEEPELQCNGKCHLKKQLDKVEPPVEDKNLPAQKTQRLELTFFITKEGYLLEKKVNIHNIKTVIGNKNPFFTDSYINEIFHPPRTSFFI